MDVPDEVEKLIADAPLSAHLATAVGNRPHVAPVWYGYRDGVLSVLTGGKKLENIRRNPRVAVSIEKQGESGPEWSVGLLGTATIIEDTERMAAAREHVFGKYQGTDEAETDGGERREASRTTEDERNESSRSEQGALVEIAVGSATSQRY